ncbi:MAG: hypothetical protein FK734_00485 [Asgard group archaeon]|nr:hypothetical protein [Asgard group archaeon]
MSEEEPTNMDEIRKELSFYKNQTKVLREKNRDLRNALLLAESQQTQTNDEETAQESISDIRKIIADSKKQITEKLSQFKETLNEKQENGEIATEVTDANGAPIAPQYSTKMDTPTASSGAESAEVETYIRQVEYLNQEIDRLEVFLEQSEMVNNRLRDLLTEHSIDVSEISKAINEVSKTAISSKVDTPTEKPEIKTPIVEEKLVTPSIVAQTQEKTTIPEQAKSVSSLSHLDPTVEKMFNAFRAKLDTTISDEEIKMEILNFREKLMGMIPHSRVFYEMQVEYRKWKKGASSIPDLKSAIKEWEKTIIETQLE